MSHTCNAYNDTRLKWEKRFPLPPNFQHDVLLRDSNIKYWWREFHCALKRHDFSRLATCVERLQELNVDPTQICNYKKNTIEHWRQKLTETKQQLKEIKQKLKELGIDPDINRPDLGE